MRGHRREVAELLDEVRAAGWKVSSTGRGHWRLEAPDEETIVFMSATPSDHRSVKNARAMIKRVSRIAAASDTVNQN